VSALNLDRAYRTAAETAAVVRSLANETRKLAEAQSASRSRLVESIVLIESLAEDA